MSVKDGDKRLASSVSFITSFRYAERFLKISRSSRTGKIICFNSWFRLKIIVVGRYTTRPGCRFTDSFTNILDLPKI